MTEDAWLRMPPVPLEYQGRELAGRFFEMVAFRQGRRSTDSDCRGRFLFDVTARRRR